MKKKETGIIKILVILRLSVIALATVTLGGIVGTCAESIRNETGFPAVVLWMMTSLFIFNFLEGTLEYAKCLFVKVGAMRLLLEFYNRCIDTSPSKEEAGRLYKYFKGFKTHDLVSIPVDESIRNYIVTWKHRMTTSNSNEEKSRTLFLLILTSLVLNLGGCMNELIDMVPDEEVVTPGDIDRVVSEFNELMDISNQFS
jgi:hypothetical protein